MIKFWLGKFDKILLSGSKSFIITKPLTAIGSMVIYCKIIILMFFFL